MLNVLVVHKSTSDRRRAEKKEEKRLSTFGKSPGLCALFVIIGAILGGILGEILRDVSALSGIMPYLVQTYPVLDMAPMTFDFYIIRLTIGLGLTPNLMSFLGIVLALLLFRRY